MSYLQQLIDETNSTDDMKNFLNEIEPINNILNNMPN